MPGGDDNSVGLELRYHLEEGGRLVARFSPRRRHHGPPGFLHGGMAATALDETMAALGYALDRVHCVTATLELRYRRPVPLASTPFASRRGATARRPAGGRRSTAASSCPTGRCRGGLRHLRPSSPRLGTTVLE